MYYYWAKKLDEKDEHEDLKAKIVEIYRENKCRYGYRRIALDLDKAGMHRNHKLILRLMRDMGIQGKGTAKKYVSYKGNVGNIAPNILNRHFNADAPNKALVTDVTMFKVRGQKVYLSPMIDLYDGLVIAHSTAVNNDFSLVMSMTEKAFSVIPPDAHPIIHSDQGWQYRHKLYVEMLKSHGAVQSMSRKGNCYDNAAAESFFGRLKCEFFKGNKFKSVKDFIEKLNDYIDYYNNRRIKQKLSGLSPAQYRQQTGMVA